MIFAQLPRQSDAVPSSRIHRTKQSAKPLYFVPWTIF